VSVEVCNVPGLEDRRSEAAWRRYVALWLDGIEPGWAIPALLAGFIVVWVSTLVLAYWNAGLHPDVLETWSVGREWVWGNAKHPPLMGWVAHGWMSIFPKTDWSFQLLATVNAAIALWSVDLIVRRLARGDKRLIVLLLLLLLPAYDFHAQRFNANSILLAVWPLATYAFLRSFEERSTLWSALAGALGALAMLGKYYSIFLLLSFCFAAICHPRRAQYFGSRAPWISLLIGVGALSPHIQWLWAHDGPTFRYAFDRAGLPFAESLADVANFYVGIAGFLVLPAIAWLVTIRFRWREWLSDLGALDESLWLLTLIFAGTILFAGVAALALSSSLPGIWHLQALFLPIVVAVCASRTAIDRVETTNLAAAVSLVLLAVLIISPLHAFYRNGHPFKEGRNYYHEAASVLTRRWHAAFGIPLAGVGGDDGLAFAVAFYSPDHPHHGRSSRYREDGWSALCFADDAACMDWMEQISQRFDRKRRFEFVVHKQLWGYPGVSRTIAAIMVPPSATEARPDTPSRR
jgi:4-amino-4-deoxy-L-arabinose transferase-like glycosyltransferase